MKHLIAARMCILAFTAIFMSMPLQSSEPEVDCESLTDNGERIKCKHGKLINEQGTLIDNLGENFGPLIPSEDLTELKNAHNRAKAAKDRTHVKEYKKIGKKPPEPCQYAAHPNHDKNSDGICDTGEKCLEIDDDGIGDDDGICKLKGNKAEVCACVDGTDEDVLDDNIDMAYQGDVEKNLEEMTAKLKRANKTIKEEEEEIQALSKSLFDSSSLSNPCDASANWHKYAEVMTMTILKQVATGLRATTDIMERGCDQTAAGFNLQAGCIIMEGVTGVAMVSVDTMEGIFKLADWYTESTKQTCLMTVYDDLQAAQATLNGIKAFIGDPPVPPIEGGLGQGISDLIQDMEQVKKDADYTRKEVDKLKTQITLLETEMTKRFDQTRDILLTPHGQRDDFLPEEDDDGKGK